MKKTEGSYIRKRLEQVLVWQVEHIKTGYTQGIRNLSLFLEIAEIHEGNVRAALTKAKALGKNFCIVEGWKISFKSIDDVYTDLKAAGIKTNKRRDPVVGQLVRNEEDWTSQDRKLRQCTDILMSL